jgi:hypothetical protein
MKCYILRDKEAEEEAKKARKAKNQGQWIRGRWNVRRVADSSGSGQSLFQDQPLEASFLTPPYWDSGSYSASSRMSFIAICQSKKQAGRKPS